MVAMTAKVATNFVLVTENKFNLFGRTRRKGYFCALMKALCVIFFFTVCPFFALAQETGSGASNDVYRADSDEVFDAADDARGADSDDGRYLNGMVPIASFSSDDTGLLDSLNAPALIADDATALRYRPRRDYLGGYYGRSLHEGLNASLDLSAFASFGKGHFSGTAERIDLMYAKPVNNRLSVAVGGYFENLNSGIGSFRAAGISAFVNYRFNDHLEAYVYAQKNLMFNADGNRFGDPRHGIGAYDYYGNYADRIGLGLRYNFNQTTFLEVQFDVERRPDSFHQNIVKQNPSPVNRRAGQDGR